MKNLFTLLLFTLFTVSCSTSQELNILQSPKTRTSNYSLNKWMENIPNTTKISKLSIPGTHDTGAYVTGGPLIITQDLTIEQQLNSGIRAMDIRLVAVNNTHLEIFHSISSQHLDFEKDVLQKAIEFLKYNPSETIIMTLKKELEDKNSPKGYPAMLREVLEKNEYSSYIVKDFTKDMTLSQTRGKIMFISRNSLGTPIIGGKFLEWPDNVTFTTDILGMENQPVHVEDVYKVPTLLSKDVNVKLDAIYQNLRKASDSSNINGDYFITFTSATGVGAYPNALAKIINPAVSNYIIKNKPSCCGIILMDFVGTQSQKELTNHIINCNTFTY